MPQVNLKNTSRREKDFQEVLQGVPFTGVQVLRWKRLILLHEKGSGEPQKLSKIALPSVLSHEALYEILFGMQSERRFLKTIYKHQRDLPKPFEII